MFFFTIIIFLLFLEFILRNYFEYLDEVSKTNNIKRVPDLALQRNYHINSSTDENTNSQFDKELGWKLKGNTDLKVKVEAPYIKESLNYNYKVNSFGARSDNFSGNKKTLGFFGCSITYGHGLNEASTFANQICKQKVEYEYLNYGVAGYSLYQSLLSFKERVKKIKFDKVIFTIHEDQQRRNTSSLSWLKIINRVWAVPGIIYFNGLKIKIKPRKYFRLFNTNIRLIYLIEFLINFLFSGIGDLKQIKKQTNEHLLMEIKKVCDSNNIELIILCLDNFKNLNDFLNKNSFNWNIPGVNLNETNQKGECKWQLMPWDNHPNEQANQIFATKILEVIDSKKRPFKPKVKFFKNQKNPQEYIYPIY